MSESIDPIQLKALLTGTEEIALIDVREQGVYSQAHLFFAVSIPISHLELRMQRLAPRWSVPVVLCDGGDDDNALARLAASRLDAMGYGAIQVLVGGPQDWAGAGLEIYSGVNVPSKAFGEFIEHWNDTPRMPAEQVQAMRDAGVDMVILDSRPMAEYQRMSIPGGVDCPGAELVYRVHEMAPDPNTTIVVNCAGRTRSIIGAQSLINAGVPNKVVALKDGTMGWELAGLAVERGRSDHAPKPGPKALALAKSRAMQVAARFGVSTISAEQMTDWIADTSRTTMLLDVRTEQEYVAGHWPGARHAPGGQLVQATDEYVATRNARIILCDGPDGVRATMTGHWLVQLGWTEVVVLNQLAGQPETGLTPAANQLAATLPQFRYAPVIPVADLQSRLASDRPPQIIDLSSSLQYRNEHIAGAHWTVRSRLAEAAVKLPADRHWVVMAPEPLLAHLACADLIQAGIVSASVFDAGLVAWRAAGGAIEQGLANALTSTDDVWFKPYDHSGRQAERMQEYLTWEVGLVEQVNREGLAKYRRF